MARHDAQDRARTHVLETIETCRRTGATKLPSVRKLAAQSECAPSVMWRTIARLRAEGVLWTRQGACVTLDPDLAVTSRPQRHDTQRCRKPKWERLAATLADEVLLGRYPGGTTLPGPKALAERCGVSYRTLRKAIDRLVDRGTVVPCRRGFLVPSLDTGHHNGAILLIARGTPKTGPTFLGPRGAELFRLVESACAKARVALEFLAYDYVNARLHPSPRTRKLMSRRDAGAPVHGVMLCSSTIQDLNPNRRDNLVALLRHVLPLEVPVVMLSETGEREREAVELAGDRLTVVSLSHSTVAGARMGRRLLALGHRRVVFLSTHHESIWSRNRLAGLTQVFSEAPEDCSVYPLVRADVTDHAHTQALRRRLDTGFDRLTTLCRRREYGVLSELRRAIGALAAEIGEEAQRGLAALAMKPLLEKADSLTDATAWVCANDEIAFACLDFLKARGRRVPEEISVAGFDDTASAPARRLTSYNFDCAGAIHAALDTIFGPRTRKPLSGQSPRIDIEGYIVERQTTDRAPRHPAPAKPQ